MTTNLTTDNIFNIPIGNLAKCETKQLYEHLTEITQKLEQTKEMKEWLHSAIALKYDVFIEAKRRRLEKDTGVIHIEEEKSGFKISNDIAKKIEWNQQILSKIAGDLIMKGANLSDYIEVTYHIPEAKYNTLPQKIKEKVTQARVIRLGNPVYKITPITQEVRYE